MYIAGIGQAVLELSSFKVGSRDHQRGISLLQKFSDIFGNKRLVPLKMTSPPHITSVQYCGGCSVHWRLFSTSGG